jgi:hypothetical protein
MEYGIAGGKRGGNGIWNGMESRAEAWRNGTNLPNNTQNLIFSIIKIFMFIITSY